VAGPDAVTIQQATKLVLCTGKTYQDIDGDGNVTQYSYDASGNTTLETVKSSAGLLTSTLSNSYDADGNLVQVVSGAGLDANGNPVPGTGYATQYGYIAGQLIGTIVDPTGLMLTTSYAYDGQGRKVATVNANGVTTSTVYNAAGQALRVTVDPSNPLTGYNGLNLVTSYLYDAAGQVISETDGVGTPVARTTNSYYDTLGRLRMTVVNPGTGTSVGQVSAPNDQNLTTNYGYDANGNLIAKSTPSTNGTGAPTTQYVYDADNRVQYTIDPLGNVTYKQYDAAGRLASSTQYATALSTTSYGPVLTFNNGLLSVTSDSTKDRVTQYAYDGAGQQTWAVDPTGAVTGTVYDLAGNVSSVTKYATPLASGTPVNAALNPALSSKDESTKYHYDGANNPISATNQAGTTATKYDLANHVVSKADALGNTTQYRYDTAGRKVEAIAPDGTVTLTGYDSVGNITKTIVIDSPILQGLPGVLSINPNGSLAYLDSQNGAVITINGSTLPGTLASESPDINAAWTTRYTAGAVATAIATATGSSATSGTSATTLFADWNSAWGINGASLTSLVTSNQYDAAGNLIEVGQPNGGAAYYFYDALGQKVAYKNTVGGTTAYVRDGLGRVVDEVGNSGVPQNIALVNSAAVTNGVHATPRAGTASSDTHYTYDQYGNVQTRTIGYGDSGGAVDSAGNSVSDAQTTTFNYDQLGRQTSIQKPPFDVEVGVLSFGNYTQLQSDWQHFWSGPVGGEQLVLQANGTTYGTLTLLTTSSAVFVGADGSSISVSANINGTLGNTFLQLASESPEFAAALQAIYGYTIGPVSSVANTTIPSQLTTDWNGMWAWNATASAGQTKHLWGGQIEHVDAGTVVYIDSNGKQLLIYRDDYSYTGLADLALQNSLLYTNWQTQYGFLTTIWSSPPMSTAFQNAWNNFWASTSYIGQQQTLGSIGLQRTGINSATYTDPTGAVVQFYAQSQPSDLAAQSPALAAHWQQDWGYNAMPLQAMLGANAGPATVAWQSMWTSLRTGSSIPWMGGTLTFIGNGQATYVAPVAAPVGLIFPSAKTTPPTTPTTYAMLASGTSLLSQEVQLMSQTQFNSAWAQLIAECQGLSVGTQVAWQGMNGMVTVGANGTASFVANTGPTTVYAPTGDATQSLQNLTTLGNAMLTVSVTQALNGQANLTALPPQMVSDFAAFYQSHNVGSQTQMWGGTVTLNADGTVTYADGTPSDTVTITSNPTGSVNQVLSLALQSPGLAQAWHSAYGLNVNITKGQLFGPLSVALANYFANSAPGETIAMLGGMVTFQGNGQAVYSAGTGLSVQLNATDFADSSGTRVALAALQNATLASALKSQYGFSVTVYVPPPATIGPDPTALFSGLSSYFNGPTVGETLSQWGGVLTRTGTASATYALLAPAGTLANTPVPLGAPVPAITTGTPVTISSDTSWATLVAEASSNPTLAAAWQSAYGFTVPSPAAIKSTTAVIANFTPTQPLGGLSLNASGFLFLRGGSALQPWNGTASLSYGGVQLCSASSAGQMLAALAGAAAGSPSLMGTLQKIYPGLSVVQSGTGYAFSGNGNIAAFLNAYFAGPIGGESMSWGVGSTQGALTYAGDGTFTYTNPQDSQKVTGICAGASLTSLVAQSEDFAITLGYAPGNIDALRAAINSYFTSSQVGEQLNLSKFGTLTRGANGTTSYTGSDGATVQWASNNLAQLASDSSAAYNALTVNFGMQVNTSTGSLTPATWQNLLSKPQIGGYMPYAGGTLTRGPGANQVTFSLTQNNITSTWLLSSTMSVSQVASACPPIATFWANVFGYSQSVSLSSIAPQITAFWGGASGVWSTPQVGETIIFGQGTLTLNADGTFTYLSKDRTVSFVASKTTSIAYLEARLPWLVPNGLNLGFATEIAQQVVTSGNQNAMASVWSAYWAQAIPGETVPMGFGTLTYLGNGSGSYTDPLGNTYAVNSNMTTTQLLNLSPYFGLWAEANFGIVSQSALSSVNNIAVSFGNYAALLQNWNSLWTSGPSYTQQPWAGGQFTQLSGDTATFAFNDINTGKAQQIVLWKGMTPEEIAVACNAIGKYWQATYGYAVFNAPKLQSTQHMVSVPGTRGEGTDGSVPSSGGGVPTTGLYTGQTNYMVFQDGEATGSSAYTNLVFVGQVNGVDQATALSTAATGFAAFLNNVSPGQQFAACGGTIACNAQGVITYVAADGNSVVLTAGLTLEQACLASPELATWYQQNYGIFYATPLASFDSEYERANGPATQTQRQTPTSTTYFDAFGNAVAYKDVGGNWSFNTYDADGRIEYSIDADGNVKLHTYDAFGNQTQLISYAKQLQLAPIAVPNPSNTEVTGYTTAYVAARMKTQTSGQDRTISYTYNQENQLVTTTEGPAYQINQGASGGAASGTFTVGQGAAQTKNDYNAAGQLIEVETAVADTIDSAGNVKVTSQANTYYYYDSMGRKIGAIDPQGYVTTWTYDNQGNMTSEVKYSLSLSLSTSELNYLTGTLQLAAPPAIGSNLFTIGAAITWLNAATGSLVAAQAAYRSQLDGWLNAGTVVQPDPMDATLADIAANPAVMTQYTYDLAGNQTSATKVTYVGVSGSDTAHELQDLGLSDPNNPSSLINPAVIPVSYQSGPLAFLNGDQVVETTSSTVYDKAGNKVETIDAQGNTDYYVYDALGQLRYAAAATGVAPASSNVAGATAVQNADTYTLTGITYNGVGEATSTVTYTNDGNGIPVPGNTGSAVNTGTGFILPAALADIGFGSGNLSQVSIPTSNDDKVETDQYDVAGHLVEKKVFSNSSNGAVSGLGNSQGSGETDERMSYDVYGREVQDWQLNADINNQANDLVNQYGYDAIGQQTDTWTLQNQTYALANQGGSTAPDAKMNDVHASYDAFGDIVSKSLNGTQTASYAYDNEGRLWQSWQNGAYTGLLYNAAGWQTASVVSTGNEIQSANSAADLAGYVTSTVNGQPAQNTTIDQIYVSGKQTDTIRASYTDYDLDGNAEVQVSPSYTDNIPGVGQIGGGLGLVTASNVTQILASANSGNVKATGGGLISWPGGDSTSPVGVGYQGSVSWDQSFINSVVAAYPSMASAASIPVNINWTMADGTVVTTPQPITLQSLGTTTTTPATAVGQIDGNNQVTSVTITFDSSVSDPTLKGMQIYPPLAASTTATVLNYQGEITGQGQVWLRVKQATGWLVIPPSGGSTNVVALSSLGIASGQTALVQMVTMMPGQALGTENINADLSRISAFTSFTMTNTGGIYSINAASVVNGNAGINQNAAANAAAGTDGLGNIVAPVSSKTYDRWGNAITSTDALGNTTTQQFNAQGQATLRTNAASWVVGTNGMGTFEPTIEAAYYDMYGDAIETVDGDGHISATAYNRFKQKTLTYHVTVPGNASSTIYDTEFAYNGLGQLSGQVTNQALPGTTSVLTNQANADVASIEGATSYFYNALGELWYSVQRDNEQVLSSNSYSTTSQETLLETMYTYDTQGNRIQTARFDTIQPNEQKLQQDNAVETDDYYDTEGHVVSTQNIAYTTQTNAAGQVTTYVDYGVANETAYDAEGNKVEAETSVIATVGGIQAGLGMVGSVQTWNYNLATGLLQSYVDLGGNQYSYLYDSAGEVATESVQEAPKTPTLQATPSGVTKLQDSLTYTYYYNQAGEQNLEVEQDAESYLTQGATTRSTLVGDVEEESTRYDANGHVVWNTLYNQGTSTSLFTNATATYNPFTASAWSQSTSYDAQGRVALVANDGMSEAYYYDGNGNRAAVLGASLQSGGAWQASQYWYAYDTYNRETIAEGCLTTTSTGTAVTESAQSPVADLATVTSGILSSATAANPTLVSQTSVGQTGQTLRATGAVGYLGAVTAFQAMSFQMVNGGGSALAYVGSTNLVYTNTEANTTANDGAGSTASTATATNVTETFFYDAI
ncbi:MAG: RHS repeat protein, partial [Burkholderiales bacterium]|nr:RHS repeat protein [Burkholderiales bacterium]